MFLKSLFLTLLVGGAAYAGKPTQTNAVEVFMNHLNEFRWTSKNGAPIRQGSVADTVAKAVTQSTLTHSTVMFYGACEYRQKSLIEDCRVGIKPIDRNEAEYIYVFTVIDGRVFDIVDLDILP